MTGLALALSAAGFLCLCASMKRHQKDLLGRRLTTGASTSLRACGILLLASAFAADLIAASPAMGVLFGCGHLTVGALVAVGILELRKLRSGLEVREGSRVNARQNAPEQP